MSIYKHLLVVVSITSAGMLEATPLRDAVKNNEIEKVKTLLAQPGINVDETDKDGWTALMSAAASGYKEIVDLLIENGAKVDAEDKNSWTALMMAAARGYEEIVELLIKNGAKVDKKHDHGSTALTWAAMNGQAAIIELLIKNGAKVDDKNKGGMTALMWAAMNGHAAVVELLIDNEADVKIQNNQGQTALSIAKEKGNARIIQLLEAPRPPLINAVIEENIAKIGALLSKKAPQINVNEHDDQGKTALIWAIASDYYETFTNILAHPEINVDKPDAERKTPLMYAARANNIKFLDALIKKKANLDAQDNKGMTALMYASAKVYTDQVKKLLEAGAAVNMVNGEGVSALFMAALYDHAKGHLPTMQALAKGDADKEAALIQVISDKRFTYEEQELPFYGNIRMVESLLNLGASPSAVDMQDQLKNTALILAVQKGKKDTVARLLDKGADVTEKNAAGKNAWDVAQELPETTEQNRAVKE